MIDEFGASLPFCLETMLRHVGQTVTIYTTSGGMSGGGFTGVLVSADINCVRLICDIGMAPACAIGSSCIGMGGPGGYGRGPQGGGYNRDNQGGGYNRDSQGGRPPYAPREGGQN